MKMTVLIRRHYLDSFVLMLLRVHLPPSSLTPLWFLGVFHCLNRQKMLAFFVKGLLEATNFSPDFRSLRPPVSVFASLYVPDWASIAVSKRDKKLATTGKSLRTRNYLAPGDGKIKLSFSLLSFSSVMPAFSSHTRPSLVRQPNGAGRLRSSVSSALHLGNMDEKGFLVVLSDRSNYAGKAFS